MEQPGGQQRRLPHRHRPARRRRAVGLDAAARRLLRRRGAPGGHGGGALGAGRTASRCGSAASELELATGDTVMFEAHAPHRYANAASEPVRFTMVVVQPGDAGLVPPTSIAPARPTDASRRLTARPHRRPDNVPFVGRRHAAAVIAAGALTRPLVARAGAFRPLAACERRQPRRYAGNRSANRPLGSSLKPERAGRGTGQRDSPPARRPRRRTSNRPVASEGRFVARHSLPRGRHVRYTLPQPVTRHAVERGCARVAGSVPGTPGHRRRRRGRRRPVRGRCSRRGRPAPVQPPTPWTTTWRRSVWPRTARTTRRRPPTPRRRRRSRDSRTTTPAYDGVAGARHEALADTVRKANEEGKRLADEQKSDNSDAASTAAAPAARRQRFPHSRGPGARASTSPGELIDTNDWYLTLPTGKEGSPDTIEGSKLATYHSKFFDLTPARNGIVFNAGADGVTTKNSHYPRSELREMNGSEKASWSNTTGTHVFDVREAFTKLPDSEARGRRCPDPRRRGRRHADPARGQEADGPVPRRQVRGGPRPELPARHAVRHPDRRRARQGGRALQRREEGRAAAVRIRLVLEGRRVRAVERQQGRRGRLGG